jgi:hypothetical protein
MPMRRIVSDDPATVAAIGVLAASLADICHEAVGHGLGCFIDHGQITLLTSIFFRCRGATALTDAAGPVASLIAGIAVFSVLSWCRPRREVRLSLVLFGGISLFWFAGQLIFHAIYNHDDWFFIARGMGWPPVWRPIAFAVGLLIYAASVRAIVALLPRTRPTWLPAIGLAYAASVLSAVVAGLMWRADPLRSAREGFSTLGVLPLGLLAAAAWASRAADISRPEAPIARSWRWIGASVVVYAAFIMVQGRGVGSLVAIGLRR